jgi:predicted dehydrogenase
VDATTDLGGLLAREDVAAVDIALPIQVMPDAVAQALAAGKHVVSEKPIAPDVMDGRALLDLHRERPEQVWMVAENWRYEAAFARAAELVQAGAIGRPIACQWTILTPMTPQNRYYHTAWRRAGDYPGGFLLDGGVHHVAALRRILGEIRMVSAVATQVSPDLPPLDTLSATLHFASGVLGSYLVSYAADAPWKNYLLVTGEAGSLRVKRGVIELAGKDGEVERIDCPIYNGVEDELAAFAHAVRTGASHRNTPVEALRDLAVVEAMLLAAEADVGVAPARVKG